MRKPFIFFPLSIILAPFLAASSKISPFSPPHIGEIQSSENDTPILVDRSNVERANGCASGYSSCSNLNAVSMCCAPNTLCALDPLGQVACCPVGSFCTGTLAANPGTTTVAATSPTSGPAMLGTTTTTTEGFVVAATTTPAAGAAPGSTIANAPFPFVFLPTTYTNAAECSSYYSSCQTEYSSCAASLGGHVNGVTVSGAGVGITVAGATATATVDASSVCSSLSAQACYGLQLSQCPSYGGSTGAVVNINAAPTRGVGGGGTFGVWGAGVVVGIVGHVFV